MNIAHLSNSIICKEIIEKLDYICNIYLKSLPKFFSDKPNYQYTPDYLDEIIKLEETWKNIKIETYEYFFKNYYLIGKDVFNNHIIRYVFKKIESVNDSYAITFDILDMDDANNIKKNNVLDIVNFMQLLYLNGRCHIVYKGED